MRTLIFGEAQSSINDALDALLHRNYACQPAANFKAPGASLHTSTYMHGKEALHRRYTQGEWIIRRSQHRQLHGLRTDAAH